MVIITVMDVTKYTKYKNIIFQFKTTGDKEENAMIKEGKTSQEWEKKELVSQIHEKATRNKPLNKSQKKTIVKNQKFMLE